MFEQEKAVIQSLIKACEVIVLPIGADAPAGMLRGFITEDVSSFVKIEGLINIPAEMKRLDKRGAQLEDLIKKLKAKCNGADYMVKVPEKVREIDAKKCQDYQTEFENVQKQKSTL